MPDDVGGQPFPDGEEPDSRDHGAADDEFASVVFDEDFVRAAEVHEPTATERILAAAQSHAESEQRRIAEEGHGYRRGEPDGDDPDDDEGRFDRSDYAAEYDGLPDYGDYGPYGGYSPHRGEHPARDHPECDFRSPYGPGTPGCPPELDPAFEHGSDYGYGRSGRDGAYGPDGSRPYRGHVAWQRPVAWVLAVVMGIGMVALAFSAVYRGASGQREPSPPPATTGVDPSSRPGGAERPDGAEGAPGADGGGVPGALPSASADTGAPTASAEPPSG
ncbi:hypothetical protein [Streptomyces boncukensis]|uniref:Uncharacterized protein n=1 Tax=Streptomyces boncukensis TaxID=2711219 RepID=A0A6G4WSD6_9ACTN|nr:hypothetical protein [Streptomyces boncukensis]